MKKIIDITDIKPLFYTITGLLNAEISFIKRYDSCNLGNIVEMFVEALEIKVQDFNYENLFMFITLLDFYIESNVYDVKTEESCIKVIDVKEINNRLYIEVEVVDRRR